MEKKYTILVTGATATGKSSFALQLAQSVSGEIINADIGSFYKPLSIGTAKPCWQEESIPHHLFDVLDTPERFSIVEFRSKVHSLIQEIWQRGNVPIIVGGSAFYIQSFFYKQQEIDGVRTVTQELEKSALSAQQLWQELYSIDPKRAQDIYEQDRYRIIRALAIFKATGKQPSSFTPIFDPLSNYYLIICQRDRELLYERIDSRVEEMIADGWVEEVKALKSSGWEDFLLHKKVIGYDDLLGMLNNNESISDVVPVIQQKTRNYAKRQVTFLKKLYAQLQKEQLPEGMLGETELLDLTLCSVGLYIRQLNSKLSNTFG